MKKGILLLGLLTIIGMNLQAQEKVGFSDPDDIQPLLDYRLPDWGYSNFRLDFSLQNRGVTNTQNTDPIFFEGDERNTALTINPGYIFFRESEKRIVRIESDLALGYSNDRREFSSEDDIIKREDLSGQFILNTDFREYLRPSVFLLFNESARLLYDNSLLKQTEDDMTIDDRNNLSRRILSYTRVGIGTGRVRNVTPAIRALRLRERVGVLADGKNLNTQQVQSAADQFTRYDGYQSRYDRPEKYFWQDMDRAINKSISGLEPFDLFYLTDVLDENLGTRLEGWDLSAGGTFEYTNELSRTKDQLNPGLERMLDISKMAGAFVEGRWFKNLSLKHQLGFTSSAERQYVLGTDDIIDRTTNVQAQFSWLWNISDRFLANTQLSSNYLDIKFQDETVTGGRRSWSNISEVSSNLTYFIENRLALNAGISYRLLYQGNVESDNAFDLRNTEFLVNAGLRYYFSRNLY